MTTYNTGNPIGSTDPRDLYDNAQNLDTAMHTAATTWADRLGNSRPSWAGATGYQSLGDYAAGIQVTTYNQVIRAAGEYWRAAAGTALPYTTTGAGMPESGKFVSVGDAVLRADLVEGDGSSIVGFQQAGSGAVVRTAQDKMREYVSVKDFGAVGDGSTDDTTAFSNFVAKTSSGGDPGLVPGAVYSVSGRPQNNLSPTLLGYATGLKEDLVDSLYSNTPRGAQYITKGLTRNFFSVGTRQGQQSTEFNFARDVDGLFIIDSVWEGGILPGAEINANEFKDASNAPITLGSITGSGNNYYFSSAQVGFSFEISFTGAELRFNHFEDTRGGAFEVFVDGVSQGVFSTWAAVGNTDGQKMIARGLTNTAHVAKFVFIGNDPLNAPASDGPRGWFKFDQGSAPNTKTAYSYDGTEYEMDWRKKTLVGSKILEFAITATKSGSGIAADWIPSHNNNVGATVPTSQRLFINGAEVVSNLDTFPATAQTIADFLLEQRYTAYSTVDTLKVNPLWNGVLRHKYEDGVMTVSHSLTTLTDVALGNAYSASLAGRGTKFVANNGYESTVVHGPNANARSAGYCSSVGFYNASNDGAIAMSVESIADTVSTGKPWQAVEPTYLVDRNTDAKLYYRLGQQNAVIPAGQKLSATSRMFVRAGEV